MRKIALMLLVLLLVLSVAGCSKAKPDAGAASPTPSGSSNATDVAGTGSPLPDSAYQLKSGLPKWIDPESGYDTTRTWKLDGGEWPIAMFLSPSQAPQAVMGFEDGSYAAALAPFGITPKVERMDGPERAFHALERSKWPIAYVPLAVFMDYVRSPANQGEAGGLQYVAVAGSTAGGGYTLLAKSPDITSIADLKGKTVATINSNPVPGTLLTKAVEEAGLTVGDGPDQVHIKMGDDALNRYNKGEYEAVISLNILKAQLIQQGSHPVTDFSDVDYTPNYTVLVVERSVLEKKPEVVKAMLEAHYKANAKAVAQWDGEMPAKLLSSWNGYFGEQKTAWAPQRMVPTVDAYKLMLGNMQPELRLDRQLVQDCFTFNTEHKTWGWTGKVDTTKLVDYRLFNEVLKANGEKAQ